MEEDNIPRGRPPGSKNKPLLKGTKKEPTKSTKLQELVEETYKCLSCGRIYNTQRGKFYKSPSPMFSANNGYICVCNDCIGKYEFQFMDIFGNSEQAAERLCQIFGWYVNESILEQTRRVSSTQPRIGNVISKSQISPHTGKTYDDRIIEGKKGIINSIDEYKDLKESGVLSVSQTTIERWGVGISDDDDYKALDEHYKMLKKQNPNCDNNQEIFVKDLCYIKLQQMAAMRDKKTDDFDKLTKLYRDTFKQAGLKTIVEVDNSNEESLGVTLSVISQYTPEEYYKDQNLYKNFDGLGDYIKRFLVRPLKNLMGGSNERDGEYCIEDDDGDNK